MCKLVNLLFGGMKKLFTFTAAAAMISSFLKVSTILQSYGASYNAIEQIVAKCLIGPGLGMKKEQPVRDDGRIEPLLLQVELS